MIFSENRYPLSGIMLQRFEEFSGIRGSTFTVGPAILGGCIACADQKQGDGRMQMIGMRCLRIARPMDCAG
jgi:hypothetical protein